VALVTLLYFAVADFLHVGRLAAYVYVADSAEGATLSDLVQPGPTSSPAPYPAGRVDPDELILSDRPIPVGL